MPNWHHEVTCRVMQKFAQQLIRYLIVTAPPRTGKSEILSRKAPGYIFGTQQHARIISTSYAATLAQQMNRELQRVMTSEPYKRVFPHIKLNEKNIRTMAQGSWLRNSEMFEIVGTRSYYKCAGIGGAATGMGFTHGLVDDFLKDYKDASSAVIREAQWDWFRAVFLTRRSNTACIAATVTRWNHDDIIGRLKKHMEKIGLLDQLMVLDFPAIQDRDPTWYDPRERGQALWEVAFPIEHMRETELLLGTRIFQALYQQNPTALEGDIVKRGWFTDNLYQEASRPSQFDRTIISVDATFDNKGNQSDFVVMQTWGQLGEDKYLLDQIRDRMNFTQTLRVLSIFHDKHKPDGIWVEEAANGAAIINTMKVHLKGILPVPVHGKGSKAVRLEAAAPQIEAGQVHLPANAPWLGTFIEEFIECPNGKHFDQIDAATLFLNKATNQRPLELGMMDFGASKKSMWAIEQSDPFDYDIM
jgi:predicted phage terminase large subunit-like protein